MLVHTQLGINFLPLMFLPRMSAFQRIRSMGQKSLSLNILLLLVVLVGLTMALERAVMYIFLSRMSISSLTAYEFILHIGMYYSSYDFSYCNEDANPVSIGESQRWLPRGRMRCRTNEPKDMHDLLYLDTLRSCKNSLSSFNNNLLVVSACPLVLGCSTDVKWCLNLRSSKSFFKFLYVDWVLLSMIIYYEITYLD